MAGRLELKKLCPAGGNRDGREAGPETQATRVLQCADPMLAALVDDPAGAPVAEADRGAPDRLFEAPRTRREPTDRGRLAPRALYPSSLPRLFHVEHGRVAAL